MNERMGGSAFLAGALVGAGVALLFAPQRGTELRGLLLDYAGRTKDELVEKGEEAWETAVERGKEYYNKGEEVIRKAGQSAMDTVEQGQEAVKEAGQSAKKSAKSIQAQASKAAG
jgi:gas vesicle protein